MTEKLKEPIQQNKESAGQPPGKKSVVLRVVKGLLIFIGIYFILAVSAIFFYKQLFGGFYEFIASSFSSGYLAMAITAIIVAAFLQIPLGKMFRSFLPFLPQKQKVLYRSLTFILLALLFFGAHLLRGNDYFDRQTGEPLQYYSIHPDGSYHFFSEPGYDPETGDKLEVVTKEVIEDSRQYEPGRSRAKDESVLDSPIFFIGALAVGGGVLCIAIFIFLVIKVRPRLIAYAEKKELEKRGSYLPGTVVNKSSGKIKLFIDRGGGFRNIVVSYILGPKEGGPISLEAGKYYLAILDNRKQIIDYDEKNAHGLVKINSFLHRHGPKAGNYSSPPITLDYRNYREYTMYEMCLTESNWKLIIENSRLIFNPWGN